jgi:DNA-directed RNA polymerase subunit RPC12/RpoP
VRCPACQSGIAIPTEWGFAVAVFQCAKCGAKLSSNAWLLSILCLVIYVPLLGAAYHVWPTFTFLIGDWLLLWLVGALCFIFIRAKKIDQPGIDPPGSTPA